MSGSDQHTDAAHDPDASTHYARLGLADFESDVAVIREAASARLRSLRGEADTHDLSRRREMAAAVLKARNVLLNPDARAAYDASLRERTLSFDWPAADEERDALAEVGLAVTGRPAGTWRRRGRWLPAGVIAGVSVLLGLGLVLVALAPHDDERLARFERLLAEARAALDAGRLDEAREALRQAEAIQPGHPACAELSARIAPRAATTREGERTETNPVAPPPPD